MKVFFKVIKIALLVFFLAIIGLATATWLMRDRISELAIRKVSEMVDAPLGMESISFSLIRDFPLATVQFNGLWMGAQESFAHGDVSQSDTLLRFEKLYIVVESKPLLDNIFNIKEVNVEGGFLKYLVNENGVSCYDFLLKGDTAAVKEDTSVLIVSLDELNIDNLTCYYSDAARKARATANISRITGSLTLDSVTTFVAAEGALRLSECSYDTTLLYKMPYTNLDFSVEYRPEVLILKEIDIETEGASLALSGEVGLADKTMVDLAVKGSRLDLATLLQYVPSQQLETFEVSQISGAVDIEAEIRGLVSDSLLPHYEAALILSGGHVKWRDYPQLRDIAFRGTITNGERNSNTSTIIKVDDLRLNAGSSHLSLKGSLRNFDRLQYDLKSNLNIDLGMVKPFVSDSVVQRLSGRLAAYVDTRGTLPDSIDDRFTDYLLQHTRLTAQLRNAEIDLDSTLSFRQLSIQLRYGNQEFTLDSINVYLPAYGRELNNNFMKGRYRGSVTNAKNITVELDTFLLAIPDNTMRGKAKLTHLNDLSFAVLADLNFDLPELRPYVSDSLIKEMSGAVRAELRSEGRLHFDSVSAQLPTILYDQSTFDVVLEDVTLDMPDTMMNVQRLSGHFTVDPQLVKIKNLKAKYSGIDFASDTTVVKNLFATVMKDRPGKLEVEGVWRLNHFDYARLDSFLGVDSVESASEEAEKSDAGKKNSQSPAWDGKYEVKGKLFLGRLQYKKALIEDISTLLNIKDSSYTLDQLKFKAFNGQMNSAVQITDLRNGQRIINLRNKLDKMDIRKLLYEMEDFDQEELTWENISGLLTTEEFFTRVVMQGDSVLYPEMRMKVDFKLENGGIYNYDKVQALTGVPGIDNMDTLLFKTIDNHLFIFDNTICVPETYIVSNKLDASIIGMQGFNEMFTYHLEIRLKELLLGASKKRRREREEMDAEVSKSDKKAKWVMLATDDKGDVRISIFPDKEQREIMGRDIRSREKLLDLRFNPRVTSFETHVDNAFRPAF